MIESLKKNQVFVFGSNIKGVHSGGAAYDAYSLFRAQVGVGEGLTGQCYALPMLNEWMDQYSDKELNSIKEAFYRCVNANPELEFLLTRVGCGIAGYPEEKMKELFKDAPSNVTKPEGW